MIKNKNIKSQGECLKVVFAFFLFINISLTLKSQADSLNPNGYNIFYYPQHIKLSEGYLKDGKPEGYWITYYINGHKKSEGNRKKHLLDSTWIFYYENGDTSEIINYYQDRRNGRNYKYAYHNDSLYLASEELYADDKKQGFSYYYYPSGVVKDKINYVDNYRHSTSYEYAEDGRLTSIVEYRYNNLVSRQNVNRYDLQNRPTGKWVEVFDNGQIFEADDCNSDYSNATNESIKIKLKKKINYPIFDFDKTGKIINKIIN